jgi:hypothetical protein
VAAWITGWDSVEIYLVSHREPQINSCLFRASFLDLNQIEIFNGVNQKKRSPTAKAKHVLWLEKLSTVNSKEILWV